MLLTNRSSVIKSIINSMNLTSTFQRENCYTLDNHMPDFYKVVFENNTLPADVDIFHAGVFLGKI